MEKDVTTICFDNVRGERYGEPDVLVIHQEKNGEDNFLMSWHGWRDIGVEDVYNDAFEACGLYLLNKKQAIAINQSNNPPDHSSSKMF